MPIGTFTPPPGKSITQFFFSNFFYFFFHFRCILLQISHQKCFFISISIPGRSGVKTYCMNLYRRLYNIPYRTHNILVHHIINSYPIAGACPGGGGLGAWPPP